MGANKAVSFTVWFFIFLSGFYLPSAFGQHEHEESCTEKSTGIADLWSLQFQIGANLSLTSFQGLAISGKRHFTQNKALRLGINFNSNRSDRDKQESRFMSDDSTYFNNKDNGTNFKVDLIGLYLTYWQTKYDILIFYGYGPLIGYGWNSYESENLQSAKTNNLLKSKIEHSRHEASFGASGVVGIEWFVKDNISLHAEYGVIARYTFQTVNAEIVNESFSPPVVHVTEIKEKNKFFDLNPTGVRFGLSVYF